MTEKRTLALVSALTLIIALVSATATACFSAGAAHEAGASSSVWSDTSAVDAGVVTASPTEPTTEVTTEPTTEVTTEPTTEAATEPPTEAATEPPTEPATAPATEPPKPQLVTVTPVKKSVTILEGNDKYVKLKVSSGGDRGKLKLSFDKDGIVTGWIGKTGVTFTAVGIGETTASILYNGKKAASITITVKAKPEAQPMPPAVISDDIDPTKPMLALTFDDGPGNYTAALMDIIEKYNVRATFFIVGEMIHKRDALLSRMVDDGCELGIHTWDHSNLKNLTPDEMRDKIGSVRTYLIDRIGYTPRLLRPPYGSYNDDVLSVAAELGLLSVNWDVDTKDWKTRSADATYKAITGRAHDGAIILCHDIHKATVQAMEKSIAKLLDMGYQLVTVSELMYYKNPGAGAGDIVSRG